MKQAWAPDADFINEIKGKSAMKGLKSQKVQLALVQAACTMAYENTYRATASEVLQRAMKDYGIEATASFTGRAFAVLGIRTVTSHGKRRFVLDSNQLEKIRQSISAECEESAGKLDEIMASFQELPNRIDSLQAQWQEIINLRSRERDLIKTINEARQQSSRLLELQAEARRLKEQEKQVDDLKEYCQALSQKIKTLSAN